MAISFSRPDPSSPSAVAGASFAASRRGYEQAEVRDFLRMVAAELGRLQERERFLESELKAIQTRGLSGPGRLDEETVTALLGEEAARVLTTAREASASIRERAEESATRLVKDASEDASRMRAAAEAEAQRIRDDAATDANSEIEMAKQQGRDMVNEARAYREKVLSELSRRRDAARAQIEQLLHGRDRLMAAFERARIASESVLGELHDAHDEPETLVNLSPTTGPIPVVNPHHPSVTAYDQEVERELNEAAADARALIEERPSVIDIPLESILDADPVEESVIAEPLIEETVTLVEQPTESIEEHLDVIVQHEDESGADTLDDAPGNDGAMSNVVSLFDRRPPSVPDAAPRGDHPVRETATRATDRSVDDIFAKLRQSSTEQVAKKAGTGDVSTTSAKSAPASTSTAAGKTVSTSKSSKTAKSPKPTTPKPVMAVADPKRFAARGKVVSPLVAAAAKKLKRALADEQNEVLEHLRNKRASLDIDAVLGTAKEHAARLAAVLTEESMTSATGGVKSVRASGATPKRVTKKAIDSAVASALGDGLVAAFREDARVALGEAEGDRTVAAALMRDVYRKWKVDGVDHHSEDALCAAYNAGAYLSLDPSAEIVWMVDPAHECCPDCADNALAGALVKGTGFPTGHPHPMAHPGCRCLIGPAGR